MRRQASASVATGSVSARTRSWPEPSNAASSTPTTVRPAASSRSGRAGATVERSRTRRTVAAMARRVLLPGDEPGLILEEEIAAGPAPAEEATFAVRADDAGAGRWHGGRAMTDQTLSAPPRVALRARWPLSPPVRRAVLACTS